MRCPCGYMGSPVRSCKCTPIQIEKYMGKVSGPLMDRIDMHIEVPGVPYQELAASADGTNSKAMREKVDTVRAIQRQRFGDGHIRVNGRMSGRQLRKFATPDTEGRQLLETAMQDLGLSARAHDRILRMARTIADLDSNEDVKSDHISEAIGYRTLDRRLWVK